VRRAAWGFVAWVYIGVRIDASWGRRRVEIGGHGHATGWGSARIGAARSAVFRDVGGRAGRHRRRRLR
jgi:hypothetical protein